MDQHDSQGHVPTPEEIARLEAEAVRALQRGEAPHAAAPAAEAAEAQTMADAPAADAGAEMDWHNVPYVDDVEPQAPPKAEAQDDEDDAPVEPTEVEKRAAAIPDDRWSLYTAIAGTALGLIAVAILLFGGEDLGSWSIILTVVIALMVPRWLESWCGRKMPKARVAMIIAILVALVIFFIVSGMRTGFQFRSVE